MEIIVKSRKGEEFDIVIFSTELLDKEFYAKHVHRRYFGFNSNTCIVRFVESTGNFIGEPSEEEAFSLIEATINSNRVHLSAGIDITYAIPTIYPLLKCREFEWDKINKSFVPISSPEIGIFKISMIEIAGIGDLSKHKYSFKTSEVKEISKKINEVKNYCNTKLENIKTEINNKLSMLSKISEKINNLNKSETTTENLNEMKKFENEFNIINSEIAKLKKILGEYKKIGPIEYRIFLVNHIMPAVPETKC